MAATAQNQGLTNTSLYVGDLHPLASDGTLHAKFSHIGPVVSARICRDITTRDSLGYGYVNFEEPQHAEKALELMNYEAILGRPIRIMWSQRDPSLRKSGKGNIFIKNLDKSIEQKELFDTFRYFGRILSCKIATDERGNSKGYGFVHFEKEEYAESAINRINNMIIRDRVVFVGKFIPKAERVSHAKKQRFNNIYVKNFPLETTDDLLSEMFSTFGEIKNACVMKDSDGKSKGFGFVCFNDPDDAENAVKTMHNTEVNGRLLFTCRAQKKEERQEELRQRLEKQKAERQSKYILNVNLYVKNLDDNVDDKYLKEIFSQHGEITSAKVMCDVNGRSKGFGFVCFAHPEQAAKAVTDMSGSVVGSKPLYVALAQRKEDRRAKLWAEHQQRIVQIRGQMPPVIPTVPTHNYFPANAFQQTQRYYHPTSAMIGSQPKWNRPGGMAGGIPTQLGPVHNRLPFAGHYMNAHNQAGLAANQMAPFAQMRSNGLSRPMVPTGMSMPTGHHMSTGAVMNQHRQVSGRSSSSMPQVMNAPANGLNQRPSMASVVANPPNVNPNIRQVAQVSRNVIHPVMQNMGGANANVKFNQTARNISTQPTATIPQNNLQQNAMPSLNDQSPLTISALAQFSEDNQKRTLGERLYPQIQALYPDLARKLTGMLLGVDNTEVIHLLESQESLRSKCEEAIGVLRSNQNAAINVADENNNAKGDGLNSNAKAAELHGVTPEA